VIVLLRILTFILAFSILQVLPVAASPTTLPGRALSPRDRLLVAGASHVAGTNLRRTVVWLRAQPGVTGATLSVDGASAEVAFADGARLGILRSLDSLPHEAPSPPRLTPRVHLSSDVPQGKALVLEPFAWQLGRGDDAGQAEITVLKNAGFSVDVLRNEQVTIAVLEHLADYSVIYMETHSNVLGTDAAIVVDDTNNDNPAYQQLLADRSVMQFTIAGDDAQHFYLGVTSAFFQKHVPRFSPSTIIFFNGCAVLAAPLFWSTLQSQGVGALIGWDNEALSSLTEAAGSYVVQKLGGAQTVSGSVQAATQDGLGLSIGLGNTAHLGFLGDGDLTLADALHGTVLATATSIPTITPTPIPTPTAVKKATKKKHKRHKKHKKPTVKPTPTPTKKPTATRTPTPKAKKHVTSKSKSAHCKTKKQRKTRACKKH
jgi:hypothetical protein